MPEIDTVVPGIKITQETVCDIPDFLEFIKTWMKNHKFIVSEEDHQETVKDGLKTTKMKLVCIKKVDDYSKFRIIINIAIADQKPVVVETKGKKQKKTKCKLELNTIGQIQSDYESVWEDKPLKKFFRGVYDTFVGGDKKAKLEAELKSTCEECYNELKAFLKLQKI